MKQQAIFGALALLFAGNAFAQSQVTIHKKDGTTLTFPLTTVDTLSDNETSHHMTLSYSKQEGLLEPIQVIQASEVNLKQADKPQSYNILQSIAFSSKENNGLSQDIHIDIPNTTITLVLPNIADRSNLKLEFETTGSYVFLNGKQIESGAGCDLSEQGEIKVVAFNGDIRTYHLSVVNSSLPILECKVNESFDGAWVTGSITMKDEKGKVCFTSSDVNIKGRGNHYKQSLKNAYNLKLSQKSAMLGLPAGKRWVLLPNAYDKTMIRSSVAFDIAERLFDFEWTPHYKPIELILNGQYAGSYTLVEQIRVAEGRVSAGQILSLEEEGEEDAFRAAKSGLNFAMRDPETGAAGTMLLRSQRIIDDMENDLLADKTGYQKHVDLSNFASWFLFNELVKNEEAMTSNGYLTLSEEGVLTPGPIWDMSKTMGGEYGDGYKNSILTDSPWFSHLLKNDEFKSLVKKQLAELTGKDSEIEKIVRSCAESVRLSVAGNEMVWHTLGAHDETIESVTPLYDEEVERLIQWLQNRLAWMKDNLKF